MTTWYDIDSIYRDYISATLPEASPQPTADQLASLYESARTEFATTSCTVSHGFLIQFQALYENMKSKVIPEFYTQITQKKSSLFFVIKAKIMKIDDKKEDQNVKLKRITLNLSWQEPHINGSSVGRKKFIMLYSDDKNEMA